MQLKDVTPIIKEILEERDKNPLVINTERYIPCYKANQYGNAVRAGLRKALRAIEQAPVVYAVAVVRCKECKRYEMDTGFCYYWETGMHWDDFCSKGEKASATN